MGKYKRKFDYFLYYDEKEHYYLLKDRNNKLIHKTIGFRTMYIYLRKFKKKYQFNRIKLKSMLLSEFFRDYVTFEEDRGSNRL